MTTKETNHLRGRDGMKRTIISAVLAGVMLFTFAGVALAFDWPTDVPGYDDNIGPMQDGDRNTLFDDYYGGWGGASPTSYYNIAEYDNGFARERPVYVRWDDVEGTGPDGEWKGTAFFNSGEFNTPHKGYDTNTTLCAVCHSVHWAPVFDGQSRVSYGDAVDAWDGGDGADVWSEKLLRTSAGNSCSYCHIETSIGGLQIYGGDASIYGTEQNFTNSFAHDYHGGSDEGCLVCHSVHGANTYDGAVASKILLQEPRGRAPQPEVIGDLENTDDPTTGEPNTIEPVYATLEAAYEGMDRFEQQVAFCTSCHWVYTDDASTAFARRGGTQFVKSHPMVGAEGSDVAFAGAGTCRTCHDAGGVNQTGTLIDEAADEIPATGFSSNNFPHYTAGNYRFLDQGGEGYENKVDVSCLKCHQNGDSGVGMTF